MTQTMLAAVYAGVGILEIREKAVPTIPHDDWVLIDNEGCGICGSDLHALGVPPGFPVTVGATMGHEFLGHVVEVGSNVVEIKVGDRVAVAPNLTCGLCRYCKMGLTNHCERWTTLGYHMDGGFTRYTVAPERSLHKVSESLSFDNAAWIEPLSCVVNGTDNIGVQPGHTAIVLGAGPIGVLHALVFKAAGARVIITDLAPFRLEAARKAGIEIALNAKEQNVSEAVMDITHGLGAEVVVDAVGNQFPTAIELAKRGGKISLFGMIDHANPPVHQFDITRKELTVYGTFVGASTFPRAIQMLESGVIKPASLNSMSLPVSKMQQGIDAARRGEAVKVIVTPE